MCAVVGVWETSWRCPLLEHVPPLQLFLGHIREWSPGLREPWLSRQEAWAPLPSEPQPALQIASLNPEIHALRSSDLATLKPACWRDHGSEGPSDKQGASSGPPPG